MSGKSRYMLVQYVTVARIPLAAASALLLNYGGPDSGHPGVQSGHLLAWVVVGLLIICELTDMFDGLLARQLGASSRFGALFDPYCDSVSRLIIFFGLATRGLCPSWLFLLMALRDVSVAYIRIMYILQGRQVNARISGKAKAWAQGLGAILLATIFAIAGADSDHFVRSKWIIVALITAITLWSLWDYFGATRLGASVDAPGSPAAPSRSAGQEPPADK